MSIDAWTMLRKIMVARSVIIKRSVIRARTILFVGGLFMTNRNASDT